MVKALEEVIEAGEFEAAEAASNLIVEASYTTAAQHHNPLEPHGCVVAWEGDAITMYDSNQGGFMIQTQLARTFGIDAGRVRIISPYTGGGFGSKIRSDHFM